MYNSCINGIRNKYNLGRKFLKIPHTPGRFVWFGSSNQSHNINEVARRTTTATAVVVVQPSPITLNPPYLSASTS